MNCPVHANCNQLIDMKGKFLLQFFKLSFLLGTEEQRKKSRKEDNFACHSFIHDHGLSKKAAIKGFLDQIGTEVQIVTVLTFLC